MHVAAAEVAHQGVQVVAQLAVLVAVKMEVAVAAEVAHQAAEEAVVYGVVAAAKATAEHQGTEVAVAHKVDKQH